MERAKGRYSRAAIYLVYSQEIKDYIEDIEELGGEQGEDYGVEEGFISVSLGVYSTKGARDGDGIIYRV
jgi:hypothetical protein